MEENVLGKKGSEGKIKRLREVSSGSLEVT